MLDQFYEQPPVAGYIYDVVVSEGTYVATATPIGRSACWEYYSTSDAKIFYSKDPRKAPKGKAGTLVP